MNKQEIEKAISLLKSDIGVLDNYLKKHPHLEEDRCVENQLIKDMEFTISALEHQLTNGWIPVSERLPRKEEANENDDVLTTRLGIVMIIKYWQVSPFNAIAWQPLPPKYEEVSE